MSGRQTAILTVVFVVCIALAVLFGFRAGRHARMIRWENQPVRGWMTVPFVAHTHHVPPEALYKAIGVEPLLHDRRPIRRLAREQKRPVDTLIKELNAVITQNGGHAPPSSAEPPKRP